LTAPFDVTSVPFEAVPEAAQGREEGPFQVLSRDMPLEAPPGRQPSEGAAARAVPVADVGPPRAAPEPVPELQGRTLADLYFAQGHYAEALRIYDELVAANPLDEEVKRLRRDAEARLLPAGATRPDPALERRLAKIRALKQWLSMLQTG
jgi:tetratricopeptide (TPR) repeat protein